MNRRSVIQVAGAFLAGVVLTLGLLVYSSKREVTELRKTADTTGTLQSPAAMVTPASDRAPKEASKAAESRRTRDARHSAERAGMLPQLMRHAGSPQVPEPEMQEPDPSDPFVSRSDLVKRARLQKAQNGGAPEFLALAVPAPGDDLLGSLGGVPLADDTPAVQTEVKPQNRLVTMPTGMRLTMNLGAALSSDRSSIGDTFGGTLASRLTVNGLTLAEKGSPVIGRIVKVKKAHLFHRVSDLGLMLTQITAKDGQTVKIDTSVWEEKSAHNRAANIPMTSGAFAAPNKRAVVLAAGTPMTFYLNRPISVSTRVN
ncbi:MAG: hypothetical protein JOY62_17650 [Acidobacteriaceae bacterium]|nr:hypothetical protein [Acidobacteriaceae bacterium]MBV9781792.1 hypothetical protein [Acidobacteriaceae bacterium]